MSDNERKPINELDFGYDAKSSESENDNKIN